MEPTVSENKQVVGNFFIMIPFYLQKLENKPYQVHVCVVYAYAYVYVYININFIDMFVRTQGKL